MDSLRRTAVQMRDAAFLSSAAAGGPDGVWAVGYRFELNAYSNRTLTILGT
jgi:hypothetical protein